MDKFNRLLDDALAYIILAVLLLMFVVVMFEQVEYDARRMASLEPRDEGSTLFNFEPVTTIDCSPSELP